MYIIYYNYTKRVESVSYIVYPIYPYNFFMNISYAKEVKKPIEYYKVSYTLTLVLIFYFLYNFLNNYLKISSYHHKLSSIGVCLCNIVFTIFHNSLFLAIYKFILLYIYYICTLNIALCAHQCFMHWLKYH